MVMVLLPTWEGPICVVAPLHYIYPNPKKMFYIFCIYYTTWALHMLHLITQNMILWPKESTKYGSKW